MSKKKSAAEPVEYIDSQAFDRYFVGKDTACSIKNVL